MTTDLTVGKPSQKLFWFSIPLLLSVAFQQLYQMADSIIVGRFAETVEAGELALAAVGASYPITQLFRCGRNRYQHRYRRTRLAAVRRKALSAHEDRHLDRTAHHHDGGAAAALIGAIGTHGIMNALSTPGEYLCGRLAVSARVCVWSAVPVYL